MNILYSCPLDPIKLLAPGQHVANVFNSLADIGHKMHLIHQGKNLDLIDKDSQTALDLDRNRFLGRIGSDIKYAFRLVSKLRQNNFDAVYHRMEKWSILPILIFRLFNKKTVLEINADIRSELSSIGSSWLIQITYPISEYIQVKLSNHIVVVSKGIALNLSRNIKNIDHKIVVIENGTNINIYYPRDQLESRTQLGLDPLIPLIVYTGSFQKWQGLETLIDSVNKVKSTFSDVIFILVGDGSVRDSLELMIKDKGLDKTVEITGWQNENTVATYLAASSICVAPYSNLAALEDKNHDNNEKLMKCSPLKIFTYMAMKKPIVASAFSDGGDRLVKWNAGVSFEPSDSDSLANALIELLKDTRYANILANNSFLKVRENHTWPMIAKRISSEFFER